MKRIKRSQFFVTRYKTNLFVVTLCLYFILFAEQQIAKLINGRAISKYVHIFATLLRRYFRNVIHIYIQRPRFLLCSLVCVVLCDRAWVFWNDFQDSCARFFSDILCTITFLRFFRDSELVREPECVPHPFVSLVLVFQGPSPRQRKWIPAALPTSLLLIKCKNDKNISRDRSQEARK